MPPPERNRATSWPVKTDMADESTVTLANMLYDYKGPLVENFSKQHVLTDQLGRETNQRHFDGLQVRVNHLLSLKQGTSGISETGGPVTPVPLNQAKSLIPMARVIHPISLTPDLIKAANGGNFAYAGPALKLEMEQAGVAMPRVENEMINGNGDAIIAGISGTTNTTAVTVATTANWYQLYPGRVIDVGTSAGGPITNGSNRTILSVVESTGVITLDSGGGNVNVTGGTHKVLIQGSTTAAGPNVIQGVQQFAATSGTVQGLATSTAAQWAGIDGRNGDTSAADLSIAILDGCERRVKRSGVSPDFYVGDPGVIDKYGQTLLTQSRWAGDKNELATGWGGVMYRNKAVVPEFDSPSGQVTGINKQSVTFYAYDNGPDWDDLDGSVLKRIGSRTLPVEAWLVDFVQLGCHRRNAFVTASNLNVAN
jgi:hypothetical protein